MSSIWHFNCTAFKHTCSMVTRHRLGNICCLVLTHWWTVEHEQSTKRKAYKFIARFISMACLRGLFLFCLEELGTNSNNKNEPNVPHFNTSSFPISELNPLGRNTSILFATFRWHDFPFRAIAVDLTWIRAHQSFDQFMPTVFSLIGISSLFFSGEFSARVNLTHYVLNREKEESQQTNSGRE